ncbi:MAG: adenosylcobinamide-GDP ribazoletransferase, partial [Clostridia bacterium]|nr:adenosylcobinamide-GDP ribazoletransferase [Clostridia bacterium]
FADPAAKGPSTAILLIFVIAATAVSILDGWPGLAVPVAALLVFLCMRRMSVRQFGGMSGDLAGFSVSVCEVLSLLLAAILGALL